MGTCNWNSSLTIYNLKTGEIINEFQPHSQNLTRCKFTKNGKQIITSSYDRTLKLWNIENLAAPIKTFQGHEMAVASFSITNDEKKLCSGSRDQSVATWDISTGQKISSKTIARNTVTCMEQIPGGNHNFVQCGEDITIRIWDDRELKPVVEIPLNENYFACSCNVDPSGTKLLTGHYACNEVGCGVILWDIRRLEENIYLWRFLDHKEAIVQVGTIRKGDNEWAVSASRDAKLKTIQMADGSEVSSYQDESKWPFSTFDISENSNGEIIAGLRKDTRSKLSRMKIGDDSKIIVCSSTDTDQEF